MRTLPISVFQGGQVVFRQFTDGNVIMPMNNTERTAVASALRAILEMVDGDVKQPSFSTVSDCNANSLQIVTDLCDHMSDADEHHIGQQDNQTL